MKGKKIRQQHSIDEEVDETDRPATHDVIVVSAYRPNPKGAQLENVWANIERTS